jgi:hypothetical protein
MISPTTKNIASCLLKQKTPPAGKRRRLTGIAYETSGWLAQKLPTTQSAANLNANLLHLQL